MKFDLVRILCRLRMDIEESTCMEIGLLKLTYMQFYSQMVIMPMGESLMITSVSINEWMNEWMSEHACHFLYSYHIVYLRLGWINPKLAEAISDYILVSFTLLGGFHNHVLIFHLLRQKTATSFIYWNKNCQVRLIRANWTNFQKVTFHLQLSW